MESLRLEDDGDIGFELVSDQDELAQCCRIALSTNFGEWFLNPELGLDFGLFTGKNIDESRMRDALVRALLQEERIRSVDEVDFTMDMRARRLTVTFTATGMDGTTLTMEEVEVGAG
jgi:phage baseplate assembly protein W